MPFTYSQLVDRAVARSTRPDRQLDIQDFVNQTIRECHSDDDEKVVFFRKNLIEDQITTTSDTGFTWTPPPGFQRMQAVRFPGVTTLDFVLGVYPKNIAPGRAQNDEDYFYYRAGTYFAFKGPGASGSLIDLGYYQFPTRLFYYEEALRPATYDESIGDFTYLTAVTDAEKLAARLLVTDWLIQDWYDVIFEGTLAKVFKLIDDTPRAVTHFSLYQRQRRQLMTTEILERAEG